MKTQTDKQTVPPGFMSREEARKSKKGDISSWTKRAIRQGANGENQFEDFGLTEALEEFGAAFYRNWSTEWAIDEIADRDEPVPVALVEAHKRADAALWLAYRYVNSVVEAYAARVALCAMHDCGELRSVPAAREEEWNRAIEAEETQQAA